MKIKEFKRALTQKIFSYGVVKFIWYKLAKLFISKKIRLNDPVDIPRTIIWGDAVCGSGLPLPKIVWTYWSGESSACAEACQKSWDVYKSEFVINRLTDRSVKEYLPDFPEVPRNVPVQLVSDLIRLMLLERYGGIWMDFSILITRPLDWVVELFLSGRHEAFAFYNEFPDEYRVNAQRPIIENGFIAARPGSKFIADWRQAHEECILSDNYKSYFRKSPEFDDLVVNFVTSDQDLIDYLGCYLAAQRVMLRSRDYSLLLMNAEDEFYYYYYKTKPPRNRRRFAEELLLKAHEDRFASRVIKITGGHRYMLDQHIEYGCFRGCSLLGKYLCAG